MATLDAMRGPRTQPAFVRISRLPDLDSGDTDDSRSLVFGGGTRMTDFAANPVLRREYPALAESLWRFVSPAPRNIATIATSLLPRTGDEHADDDWRIALLAFDVLVDVAGPGGARTVTFADLQSAGENAATENFVVRIRIPATRAGLGSADLPSRAAGSYAPAAASTVVAVIFGAGQVVEECRIALGGIATRPWRARGAERLLTGQPLTTDSARAAAAAALCGACAHGANACGYPAELAKRVVTDALHIAAARARRSSATRTRDLNSRVIALPTGTRAG
jgi:xanthine dehydrogenase YagS FAD-binding subunit